MARAVLAAVRDDNLEFASLDREILDSLLAPPDPRAVARALEGRKFWRADAASPPVDPAWPLAPAPSAATVAEVRANLAGWPEASVTRLIALATAHMRFTHRGCDEGYFHMATSYFVGVWILDHVIDDALHNQGFGADTEAVLGAMMEARSELLPESAPFRNQLVAGIELVARCRSRLHRHLTPEGAAASWLELRKWFAQVAPEGARGQTARAQGDAARFVQYRTLNSGMPWVLLTVWYHRSQSTALLPPPKVARTLRCLAFVTALYNDLMSVPEDGKNAACNGVFMLMETGTSPTLGEAIDRAIEWYNAGLAVLARLQAEADDPTLDDLCDGFVAGMAVWQNAEPKYAVGARALQEHGAFGRRHLHSRGRLPPPVRPTGEPHILAGSCPNLSTP